jgi:serine phosphatase RsbU (regulator of sigma subunit)
MTYQNAKRLTGAGVTGLAALAFAVVPQFIPKGLGPWPIILVTAAAFVLVFLGRNAFIGRLDEGQQRSHAQRPENRIIHEFAARVGSAFTLSDLSEAAKECLEKPADMSILFLRSNTWEVIYQSPTAVTTDQAILDLLERNFRDWTEGFTFMNEGLSLAVSAEGARGFFIHSKGFHFFVFTRLCSLIEEEAFRDLYGELRIYFDRTITISDLFEVASLSKEWELVAETQRSFLPKKLPEVKKLDLSISYRPLINVSGDYYDAIAVDEDRTLLLIGDVSGKGLAAGLIMGIIVNTIRVAPDKSDLAAIVRTVDEAVREMGFDDKYTVLFLGLVDTAKKTLRYINAAMADPLLVAQTALGPKVKRLAPTMGLIGLVPIEDEVEVEEIPLRTDEIILLASDGVTEVANASGLRLGDADDYERAILQASKYGAEDFISSITGLLYAFVGDAPLKDDVTILAAKVGRLWD